MYESCHWLPSQHLHFPLAISVPVFEITNAIIGMPLLQYGKLGRQFWSSSY